jgi:hypothetical protein
MNITIGRGLGARVVHIESSKNQTLCGVKAARMPAQFVMLEATCCKCLAISKQQRTKLGRKEGPCLSP